ncbi:hypothetical protein HPP92_026441 [Vanilla planifolia]|nr:hypothetical protein HPP92_026441 [Vanilla planifolia]
MSGKRKQEKETDRREEGTKRKLDTSPGSSPAEASAVPFSPTPTATPGISAFPSTAPPSTSSTFPSPATGESTIRPIHEGSASTTSRPIRFREWTPASSSNANPMGSASPAVGNIWPHFPEMVDETVPTAYQDSSSATDVSSSHPVPDCWSPVREETASSTSFEFVRSDRDPQLPTPPRPISASAYLPYRMPGDRRVHKYAVYRRGRFVITQPLPDTFEPGQELPPLFNKPFRFVDSPNFPVPNELRITGDSSDQRNRPPNERSQGLDLSDRLRNVRIDDVEHQAYLTLQVKNVRKLVDTLKKDYPRADQ